MRRHLSYSNVVATLALFIALGGSSYAAIELRSGQVKTRHLSKNAITGFKVADRSLRREDLRPLDRGPLSYPPFSEAEGGRVNALSDGTALALSGTYATVPETQVDVPARPNGRRDIEANWLVFADVLTRSAGGEGDMDCAIATVGSPYTQITARGAQTLRPRYSQLSFAGFYQQTTERDRIELRCRLFSLASGTHEVVRAKLLVVAAQRRYANIPTYTVPVSPTAAP